MTPQCPYERGVSLYVYLTIHKLLSVYRTAACLSLTFLSVNIKCQRKNHYIHNEVEYNSWTKNLDNSITFKVDEKAREKLCFCTRIPP